MDVNQQYPIFHQAFVLMFPAMLVMVDNVDEDIQVVD
jgi:hypothetical protein